MKKSTHQEADPTPEQFAQLSALVEEWTTIPDIAEALDVIVTRVHALVDDGAVLAFRDPTDGVRRIPAIFTVDGKPLDSLRGTISVLRDAGFSDLESALWLLTPDESLPGRPVDLLHAGRKTEVRRRAQAMAW
ncbi:DNA-binding protein [Kocuria soli]|uniref:DNA-binding protein n=1 Tax=Kocuria soli TaxID=2485125 RepID=A0A3N4A5M1_9MICC|nr:Rv2175c family DNA-binding protein [Kocuria soli]ROZ64004.1 DNA-binding protein [Kocuria soli]